MPYKLVILPIAEKELKKLPLHEFLKVDAKIQNLSENARPNGYKKLRGLDNTFRIRSGDYRIVYTIEDNRLIIEIIKIGHRKDIYK